jgi:histone H3/H4
MLEEFFVAIQGRSISELLAVCREFAGEATPARIASPLEGAIKQRLRKVGGKAADFIPYLFEEVAKRTVDGRNVTVSAKMTLSAAVLATERYLGSSAGDAVDAALKTFVTENDVSYQLKGGAHG